MNRKPEYCTKNDVADCCLCELNRDGFDCKGNRIFINLVDVLEEVEELEMVLEEI
jgi:hypothetical protein